jgi:hypothetical protein
MDPELSKLWVNYPDVFSIGEISIGTIHGPNAIIMMDAIDIRYYDNIFLFIDN